jgi:O-antigen/teichoic acid export membrane protein
MQISPNNSIGRFTLFARLLGSAIVAQALLSAANLCVGLILIRRTDDQDYGYYVLVLNALMLITQIQTQFIAPAMILRMSDSNRAGRATLIGSIYRLQRFSMPFVGAGVAVITVLLWLAHSLSGTVTLIILAAIGAALTSLYREFFRMVLLAYRRPHDVLRVDTLYVVLLVASAMVATLTPFPALVAVLFLCLSTAASGSLLARALWNYEPWDIHGPNVLRQIATIGAWTTAGAAIHWTFAQGYNYLIVGTLDVRAVAAVAATRLLMMPVNMLSTGVASLMLPTTSAWLRERGVGTVFIRLLLLSCGITCLALCYFLVVWLLRDWLFAHVLHKQFAHRDQLMFMWFFIFSLMVFRDQLLFLPLARGRFKTLTGITFLSAVLSLSVSYVMMKRVGVEGALIGVLTGEIISVLGLVLLSTFEMRRSTHDLKPARLADTTRADNPRDCPEQQ